VRSLTYHLLFREPHTGMAWFDHAFLGQQGSDENLLDNGNFEPDASAPKPLVDGAYIDSFEMGAKLLNYRREHFASAYTPLIFDLQGRLCQMEVFYTVEFAREVAKRMWEKGKMTFANATPYDFPWPAAWLDVMGTESDWGPNGKYVPNPDSLMNYRRALCSQRPYLLLLNTDYDRFKPEWVERYMKRCAAYGFFPSMFSHNGADDPYWQRRNLYNRDRPLFKKFIPVISALSHAGWEPVTYARSDNPRVFVERFGKPGGPLYLTLFNDSHEPQYAKVSVDLILLKPGATRFTLDEILSTTPVTATASGAAAAPEIEIGPEDVRVLRLQ
jgi:hypothetical protein